MLVLDRLKLFKMEFLKHLVLDRLQLLKMEFLRLVDFRLVATFKMEFLRHLQVLDRLQPFKNEILDTC